MTSLTRKVVSDWPVLALAVLLVVFLATMAWPWLAAFTGCLIVTSVRNGLRRQRDRQREQGRAALARAQASAYAAPPACGLVEAVQLKTPLTVRERAIWVHTLAASYNHDELDALRMPGFQQPGSTR
jgi:hypothetical protein